MVIRALLTTEPIPYHLLLLADETLTAIDKYLKGATIFIMEKTAETLGAEKDLSDGEAAVKTHISPEPIGIIVLLKMSDTTIEVKNIAVKPEYQGRGYGTQLLAKGRSWSQFQGFQYFTIGTPDKAHRQLALYDRFGFERWQIRKDFFLNNYKQPIYEDGVLLRDMVVLRMELI